MAHTAAAKGDSPVEAGLAATLSVLRTPIRARGREGSIEGPRSAILPSAEIASAAMASVTIVFGTIVFRTIAFAAGDFITSDSGTVLAADAGVDGLGGMPATTIRIGGGILVQPTTRTGPAKSSWQTR